MGKKKQKNLESEKDNFDEQQQGYKAQSIEDNAQKFGYKTANLMHLQDMISGISGLNSSVQIPNFTGVEHDSMQKFLHYKIDNFDDLWKDFTDSFAPESGALNVDSKQKLSLIREAVQATFANATLEDLTSILGDKAFKQSEQTMLMVRSTGREDSTTLANPGGNESLPCKYDSAQALLSAIGGVVESYFSEKSINQRIKSGDDKITELPFTPVLLQEMVGETVQESVYSGVMFTSNGASTMQVAPGHGELVVNSKGNTDSFYVSAEGNVYSEIKAKGQRMKSELGEDGKMHLAFVDNDSDMQLAPSISEEVAQDLHKIANHIEQEYGMRMDMEFIYNPKQNTISLVQARALPEGKRKGLDPSAIAPAYLKELVDKGGKKEKGISSTPDVKEAIIINNPEEIFVCDNVSEALGAYLGQSGESGIKAVIIKSESATTSHESSMFNSRNIPVIQMDNLANAKNWQKELANKTLVLDAQRQTLTQLPKK